MRRRNPSFGELKMRAPRLPLDPDASAPRILQGYYELNYKLGMMKTLPWHAHPRRVENTIALAQDLYEQYSEAVIQLVDDATEQWIRQEEDTADSMNNPQWTATVRRMIRDRRRQMREVHESPHPVGVRASMALQIWHGSGDMIEHAGVTPGLLDVLAGIDPEARGWNDELREIGVQI